MWKWNVKVTKSCLTLCDPMDYNSRWNSPAQNTGVGNHSLLQGIFPTQVSHMAGGFSTSWATREAQEYWSGSPVDLPDPGIEPGCPALQANSLPSELSGKPLKNLYLLPPKEEEITRKGKHYNIESSILKQNFLKKLLRKG